MSIPVCVSANSELRASTRSLLFTPLLFLALAATVHAEPCPMFGPGTNISTYPGEPLWVAIADFNGDGVPDLVVWDDEAPQILGGEVSVLLGNGDGTFGARKTLADGVYRRSVAIADLNADGRLDLVTADGSSTTSNTGSVLLGNGDGTFSPGTSFVTAVEPFQAAIADLNADGLPDLAVACNGPTPRPLDPGTGALSVLLGNGNGTFGPKTDFDIGLSLDLPGSPLAIGDLNGDGRPDLVVANYSSSAGGGLPGTTVSVLLGNGDGTFGPKTDFGTGNFPNSVAIADLNADGRPDLTVTSGGTVSVLLGHGDGTFGPKTDFASGSIPSSVAIADLNQDGRPDLVTANYGSSSVSVLLGNGDGTFGPKTDIVTGQNPMSVAIADLNADEGPDLAVANFGPRTVTVLLNSGPCPCPSVAMSLDLNLSALNLQSMGHWVTVTLEPDPPVLPSDIYIASIRLNKRVPVDPSAPVSIGDADGDGRPDLTVKFNRAAMELAVGEGDSVAVKVTGKTGIGCFSATDTTRLILGHVTAPIAGDVLQAGTTAQVRWDTPSGVQVQSVAVLYSSDDGSTWSLVAHELPNTGTYLWTVPDTPPFRKMIAVVLVESADESGYQVTGVLGVSGRFFIASPLAVSGPNTGLSLSGSVPNPSRDLRVSFTLPDAKPARLVVYDVSGREVSRREVGSLGAGRHVVTVGASGRLAAGIYLVHLIQGDRRLVARAVVAR